MIVERQSDLIIKILKQYLRLKKQQIIGNIVEKKVIFAKIAIKSRKILTDKTLTEYRILQTASNGGFLFTISTKYMLLLRLFLIK